MRICLLFCLVFSISAVPRDVVQFTGFKVNYNPGNHNEDNSFHRTIQSVVDYMKNLGSKISGFFSSEEAKTVTAAPSTTEPPVETAPTPSNLWFGTHWKWPSQRKTTTPATPIFWSPESRPGSCPTRVDAYVDVKGGALLFQGDKVYTIRNRTILSSSTLEKMFPNLNVAQITAGLYNKDKELLILFNERTVWGLLWFENSQSWKVMDDYPKNLPQSIPFTPHGAIRWIDDSQVLLSEDGRLAMYDEVLNEPLTTGSTRTYLKGLPEKIKGASRWTEKGAVRIFTETVVFDYEKSAQKLEGTPLKQFLVCKA